MNQIVDKPSPITGGLLELRTEPSTVEYRGETIYYEKSFYHCVDSKLEFTDEELEAANLKLIYDSYCRRHKIPLAEELKEIRESYGLPSTAMSLILGLGENQYGLYEDGVVPTPSIGRLLNLVREPGFMIEQLVASRSKFTEKQYRKYYYFILASMPPTVYETEREGFADYCIYPSFPSAEINIKQPASYQRRSSYNEYIYAPAC
ncbi:MAG: hypothetical protein K6G53_05110 [Bacteroidales bacterium]|nr:hypothetical protein [Bacteroidales bacterium]